MKSTADFKKDVKIISDYAFANAIHNLEKEVQQNPNIASWDSGLKETFLHLVHDGFKKAQDLLIEEIMCYQNLKDEFNVKIKEHRRRREKKEENETLEIIEELDQRLKILAHIADGIAWQLIGGQVYISKRLYLNDTSKALKNSNINHAKSVADKINEDKNKFALISDITNFVQIGDLIIKDKNTIGIAELKEGKVNEELLTIKDKILTEPSLSKQDFDNLTNNLDNKKKKQLLRMLNQDLRILNTVQVINTYKGIDIKTGSEIEIITPKSYTKTYSKAITDTINDLQSKNWAYSVTEFNIVHVGAYKSAAFDLANYAIPFILSDKSENFVVADYSDIIKTVSEPIFAKPFSPDIIFDILFNDLKVIIGIDLDELFLKLKEFYNIDVQKLTRKETQKLRDTHKGVLQDIFTIRNCGFKIINQENGKSFIMGGGIITKLLYDNMSPLTVLEYINDTLQ